MTPSRIGTGTRFSITTSFEGGRGGGEVTPDLANVAADPSSRLTATTCSRGTRMRRTSKADGFWSRASTVGKSTSFVKASAPATAVRLGNRGGALPNLGNRGRVLCLLDDRSTSGTSARNYCVGFGDRGGLGNSPDGFR